MELWVNGESLARWDVGNRDWGLYTRPGVPFLDGSNQVDVVFANDAGERDLFVDYISVEQRTFQAEAGNVVYDLGSGMAAFDGQNTVPGQERMSWDGALRFRVDWDCHVAPTPTPTPTPSPTPQPIAPIALEGVVFHDRNENGVQDGGEPGISSVGVVIRSEDDSWIETTLTDDDGCYTFRLPGPGVYKVYVRGMPYPFQYFTTPSVFSIMVPRDLEKLGTGLALRFGLSRRILWLIQLILLGLLLALLAGSVTAVRIRQAVLERNRLALAIADQIRRMEQGGTHVRS